MLFIITIHAINTVTHMTQKGYRHRKSEDVDVKGPKQWLRTHPQEWTQWHPINYV